MRHISTTLALVLLWVPLTEARASESGPGTVEVSRAGSRALHAEPGETVTAVFVVRNTSDEPRTFSADITLPANWQLVNAPSSFVVAGGAAVRRLISFRVSSASAARTFRVGFRVRDIKQRESRDEASVSVHVGETRRLDIEVLASPEWVPAASEYDIELLVANAGNAPVSFEIETTIIPEAPYTLSLPRAMTLGPGETRSLIATIAAPATVRRRQRQWFRVKVKQNDILVGERSVSVDVLPVHGEVAPASRYPLQLRLNGFESYRGRGGQVELEGRGPIRSGGSDIVAFGVRTPDLSSSSLFARRDEYHATYISERWAVMLGDHRFDLSPLTEFGRRARGVGVVGYFGPLSATGFYGRSRYALPKEGVFGFNLSYEPHETVRLGANFIDKSGEIGGESVTLRSEYSPIEALVVDLELGDGLGSGQAGIAFAAGVTGRHDRGQASARFMRTGSEFPGLYQDLKSSTVAASARLTPGLDFSGSLIVDQRGVQQGLGISSTVSNRFARLGPTVHFEMFGGKGGVSGVFESRAQSAVFDTAQEDRDMRGLEVRVQYGIGRYTFSASAEAGSASASFSPGRHALSRYEFSTGANLGATTIHAAIELDRGATMYRLTSSSSTMLALGADGRIGRRLTWSADGLLMVDSGVISRRYQSLSMRANYALPRGHVAGIRSNLSAFGSDGVRHDVALSYEVPLSIGTLGSSGAHVRGVVVDAETGQRIRGAVVRIGNRSAQTDGDGAFKIPAAQDGREFLILEAGSIGLDRVPLIELPREVDEAMLAGTFEIPVAHASAIRGTVRRYAYSDGSRQAGQLTSVAAESGVVVEFTDGIGRHRATSNREGSFSLPGIRPGTWTVRIVYANLPESHIIGEPVTVQVQPGETVDIELRVIPRRRTIRFIDGGHIGAPDDAGQEENQPGEEANQERDGGEDTDEYSWVDRACVDEDGLPRTHVVARGETLTALAADYYCNPILWPLVWFSNEQSVADPHWVYPGQELRIVSRHEVLDVSSRPDTGEAREHVMQKGETLQSLASTHYGDEVWWPRIWVANRGIMGDDPTASEGSRIVIPGTELGRSERRVWASN